MCFHLRVFRSKLQLEESYQPRPVGLEGRVGDEFVRVSCNNFIRLGSPSLSHLPGHHSPDSHLHFITFTLLQPSQSLSQSIHIFLQPVDPGSDLSKTWFHNVSNSTNNFQQVTDTEKLTGIQIVHKSYCTGYISPRDCSQSGILRQPHRFPMTVLSPSKEFWTIGLLVYQSIT